MEDITKQAEEPLTVSGIVAQTRRLMTVVYIGLTIGTVLMFATGSAAMTADNGNTSILHGWNHGFYVIPEFVASLVSSDYSVYQTGGGAFYNIGYVAGIALMARTLGYMLKK